MLVTERKLVIMSGICAVAGLAALFLVAAIAELPRMSASEAAGLSASQGSAQGGNAKARVHGFVDSVVVRENYAVVDVASLETVKIVSFDTGYISSLGLKKFQEIEATGEFRSYNGKNSFIAAKIRPLSGSIPCGG